ncbi:MAG: ABC transporter permease [Sedimentisphaerales bacterium]|nr:ABC transporter permease [Sedimentisphaerales bacterium]
MSLLLERLLGLLRLSWLTGPIFDKELRVSSRRRRNYALRFVYVAAFTLCLAMIWRGVVSEGSSSVYQSSRRAEAGQLIVVFVVWFQFIAAQTVAMVMLSTSISDEIYNRTLGLLMTTPVGSFQIVFGKLLSKLLQLILLLAVTLPLFAIVRVLGGVPWDFVLCGLCVTLATVAFVGSLSLFFSIFTRKAYRVITTTAFALGVLFAILPLVSSLLLHRAIARRVFMGAVSYLNPFLLLFSATNGLMSAQPIGFQVWPVYCGIVLGLSGLLLLLATVFVRRAALRQAVGQGPLFAGDAAKPRRGARGAQSARRVVGPAVLWKERRSPLLGKRKTLTAIGIVVTVGFVLFTYGLCINKGILDEQGVQASYVLIFTVLGILYSIVLPATSITAEKESRTWALLLTTTVGNGEIIWSKFAGGLRRCLPTWLLLFGHLAIFVSAGIIHGIAIVQLAILVFWVTFFLSSTGLYFSSRFRHTTTAVVANMTVAVGLWAIGPLFLGITLAVSGAGRGLWELYVDLNPIVHTAVIASATTNKGGLGLYDWIQGSMRDVTSAMAWIALTFVLYVTVGLLFVWRAAARLRRYPF